MKRPLKRLLKGRVAQAALVGLLVCYMRVIYYSSRRRITIHPDAAPYMDGTQNGVFCFWHGRLLMVPFIRPKARSMQVLISHHRDGELIARAVDLLGVDTVRGSTSKGSRAAMRQMIAALSAGHNIGITPDGPRGPFQQAAPGAAMLAKISKQPLIPIGYSARRGRHMRSWDRFLLPYPFTTLTFVAGAPVWYNQDGAVDVKSLTHALQEALNAATDKADAQGGFSR